MKKADIINTITKLIQREAYTGRVCDELQFLGFDTHMMKYNRENACGKAFGAMEIMNAVLKECDTSEQIYNQAVENATQDIYKAENDIVCLLDLAGYDGKAYYEVQKKYQAI